MRIFRDSVPDKEYPVGTILQLMPFEAMVKHPREKFPNTNGWELFFLDVSKAGIKIAIGETTTWSIVLKGVV